MNTIYSTGDKLVQYLPLTAQHILFLSMLMAIDDTYDNPVDTTSVVSLPSRLVL